jgi:hypothetical protein
VRSAIRRCSRIRGIVAFLLLAIPDCSGRGKSEPFWIENAPSRRGDADRNRIGDDRACHQQTNRDRTSAEAQKCRGRRGCANVAALSGTSDLQRCWLRFRPLGRLRSLRRRGASRSLQPDRFSLGNADFCIRHPHNTRTQIVTFRNFILETNQLSR